MQGSAGRLKVHSRMCKYSAYLHCNVGPNEAGADFLKQKVERMLEKMDAVIYLLDYTKIGTLDTL